MPDALLSFVRLAGAVGIEPTQAILETASPALEHALLYSPRRAMLWVVPGFSHWPDNLITPVSRVVPPPPSCGRERDMCPTEFHGAAGAEPLLRAAAYGKGGEE